MNKRYLVTGTWIDKATKQPKSSAVEISEGTSKDGNYYALLNMDTRLNLDKQHKIGEILEYAMTLVPATGSDKKA